MTDSFTDNYNMVEEYTTAVKEVINKIPSSFIDDDIAHAVQVLFRDYGAGANFTKLKQVIAIIYDHALPTGARNDKMVFLLAHIVRPKPEMFEFIHDDRNVQAETLAHEIIMNEIYAKKGLTWLGAEVWDRRPFDIIAELVENHEHLKIRESEVTRGVRIIFVYAATSKHLFQKVNFDLFARFAMDHGHMIDSVESLQKVAKKAESESLDIQLMAAGLLSIVKERRSARGGG